MIGLALVLGVLTYATPIPLKNAKHVAAYLPAGATARISARGNNVPCWESPQSLTAFERAYQTGDQSTIALEVAQNAFLLREGQRVRGLNVQGLLGTVTRLKIVDGDHAGETCYEPSSLNIYTGVKKHKH